MPKVAPYLDAIQYDGTNAAHICGTWADVEFVSEDETGMVVNIVGDTVVATPVPLNAWLVKNRPFPGEFAVKSPQEYAAQFVPIPGT